MTNEAYGKLRALAAVWVGTSVLITNRRGRVLLQRVCYRPTRLPPEGAVDVGESPAQGAARELEEELGVTATVRVRRQCGGPGCRVRAASASGQGRRATGVSPRLPSGAVLAMGGLGLPAEGPCRHEDCSTSSTALMREGHEHRRDRPQGGGPWPPQYVGRAAPAAPAGAAQRGRERSGRPVPLPRGRRRPAPRPGPPAPEKGAVPP
jgi:hypothetical protein